MYEVSMDQVFAQVEDCISRHDYPRAEALLWPAMDQFPHIPQCYFHAGNIFFRTERPALAALCYQKAIELDPNSISLANLGAALRQMNRNEDSLAVLEQALEFDENNVSVWTNLCACFVNEGNPKPGIEAGERALAINPDFGRAMWNLGLLYLENGQFEQGWRSYRSGLGKERMIRKFSPEGVPEPEFLTPELHASARGTGKTVIAYGEQGIGDELMMGSMLFDLKRDYDVVLECHPRLEKLHRVAHPDIRIYPTRKDEWINWPVEDAINADFKLSLGDLGGLYRNRSEDFTAAWAKDGPFYRAPDADEIEQYRELLEALAEGRKIIGLATRGGVIRTMRLYRSLDPQKDLAPLFERKDCMFVALDYEDVDEQCRQINEKFGEGTIYNFPAITQHWDYDHVAALVKATDAVVTVCQSVAHLSAGMGHRTLVLTPAKPAWRYGVTGERWYWYDAPHAKLYRQQGVDWLATAATAAGDLR